MVKRAIDRQRTAINRKALSHPTACVIRDELLTQSTPSVLDFGCGRGGDSQRLREMGFYVACWDREFCPKERITAASIVLLNFVLNTIEWPAERTSIARITYALADSLLVVAVRVGRDPWKGETERYHDGVRTESNTFQKIYKHDEFCQGLADTLDAPVYGPEPGIAYVFKDQSLEEKFLARCPSQRSKKWESQRGSPTAL